MTKPTKREEAIRNGVVVHRVGVDPWEHAQEAMARGCYVQFEFCPPSVEATDAERANDE
jgi:hypothetical protein